MLMKNDYDKWINSEHNFLLPDSLIAVDPLRKRKWGGGKGRKR